MLVGETKMRFKGVKLAAVTERLLTVDGLSRVVENKPVNVDTFYDSVENFDTRERLKRRHTELANRDSGTRLAVPDSQIKRCKMSGALITQEHRVKQIRFLLGKRRLLGDNTTVPYGFK